MRLVGRRLRVDPVQADTALAVVLTVVTIVYGLQSYHARYRAEGWRPFDLAAAGLCVLVALPLAVRRRHPWPVLVLSVTGLLVYTGAGFQPSVNVWPPLLAGYTVIARRPPREAVAAGTLTGGAWIASGLEARLSVELAVAQSVIALGIVGIFATGTRRLAERNAQLAEATDRLRREQELRARHAVVEERVRIARELHDVIAHHLSALAVQAGVAEYVFASDPPAARAALAAIGATSREALEEMRGLLQVLRVSGEVPCDQERLYRAAPGLAQLGELVERTRAAGVPVRVVVAGPTRMLAPGVDLCAFRVVQEALTNVIKHAGRPATATVDLCYRPDRLEGRITDDGPGNGRAVPGSGLGLIGIRERVRLYGGSVHTGPRPDGGFEVAFTLPVTSTDP
ncbi:sensor histidine kinase [Kitasatospora aureofaciens]|uniref:sensor histidine kinase n=1 Tax=Kitasatospora aureofaciens TaxID=1894 RepID=UPI000997AE54|nr:sensor histidine kinase [Kitasatospora aureofaciens]HJD84304.1 sensor histidine kinase [Kitasatospora aureofaciens]